MEALEACKDKSVTNPEGTPTARRRALRELQQGDISSRNQTRELQKAAFVEQTDIFNPVYCINQGDSFMFNIPDPEHYPIYMRDSVINSNPTFDYGAFIELEQ